MRKRSSTIIIKLWVVLFSSLFFWACLNKKNLNSTTNHQTILDADLNYYDHIQPILQEHCVHCHSDAKNKVAPFSLTTFGEVQKRTKMIQYVIENNIMPPWPANPNYRHFKNENYLSEKKKIYITTWIMQGAKEGTPNAINDEVVIKKNEVPGVTLQIKDTFYLPAGNKDLFQRFALDQKWLNEQLPIKIRKFRFLPGNKKIVHHTEFLKGKIKDKSNIDKEDFENLLSTLKNEYIDKKSPLSIDYVTGWFPGIIVDELPDGIYIELDTGFHYFFLIHYAPSPVTEKDFTRLEIYPYDKNIQQARRAESFSLHGHSHLINDEKFLIPKNEKKTLHATKKIDKDISVYSILAHMHHVATSVLAYAITPEKDTVPLLKIDHWDFDWQMEYKLDEFLILPQDTEVHFIVEYDNTDNNTERPLPPKDIPYSFDADDEMMELFLHYVETQEKDKGLKVPWPQ